MLKRIGLIVGYILLVTFAAGCGGGSGGTDGGVSIRIVGTVKSSDGKPLPGVAITIKENGDTASTDNNGQYSVDTTVTPGLVDLIVSKDNKETETSFEVSLSRPDQTIAVDLTLDEVEFAATIASVTIVQDPLPTPQPSARPTQIAIQTYDIAGSLRTEAGAGVPGFTVKVQGSSITSKTDTKGAFRVSTKDRTPSLIISNKRHSVSVRLGTIPDYARLVKVVLTITIKDDSGGGIGVQAVNASFHVKVKGHVSY